MYKTSTGEVSRVNVDENFFFFVHPNQPNLFVCAEEIVETSVCFLIDFFCSSATTETCPS